MRQMNIHEGRLTSLCDNCVEGVCAYRDFGGHISEGFFFFFVDRH